MKEPADTERRHVGQPSFVSHLECSLTGQHFAHDRLHGLSPAGAPLLVRYDLAAVRERLNANVIRLRPADMWRWRELLPLGPDTTPIDLGEAVTPLVRVNKTTLVKDEGRLPTGSFKARGMAVAVTMAKQFGKTALAVPTAGNAGAAAAAYGAAAGMDVYVFTPEDTPEVTVREIAFHGAATYRVNGLIGDCGRIVRAAATERGWHDLSTLAEPYRLEGKKTMGLELAAQLNWRLPDVIYYPTGGGTGFIGMWKAFHELQAIGLLEGHLPRMVAVQSDGCSPIQCALEAGSDDIEEAWAPVRTQIHGVRVPKPLGGRLILQVIHDSGGHATSVSDAQAFAERNRLAAQTGLNLCPEGAACVAAHDADLTAGRVRPDEHVVIFNTANGLKTPMPAADNYLDCHKAIDYQTL